LFFNLFEPCSGWGSGCSAFPDGLAVRVMPNLVVFGLSPSCRS
jgi:hypothetical protein